MSNFFFLTASPPDNQPPQGDEMKTPTQLKGHGHSAPQETDCRKPHINQQEAHLNSPLTTSSILTPLGTYFSHCIHSVIESLIMRV